MKIHKCSCGREIRGNGYYLHQKKCRQRQPRIEGDLCYVPLANTDRVAIIDRPDLDRIRPCSWRYHPDVRTAYAATSLPGRRTVRMHQLILDVPDGMVVDHINFDGLDNRRQNLRIATASESMGSRRLNRNNTSGFRGVYPVRSGRWIARIGDGQYLGTFDTAVKAARAYDVAARLRFGGFAELNFPEAI